MPVAGEEQHLNGLGDIGQRDQGLPGTFRIEVDQHVINHNRQRLIALAIMQDVRQTDRQKQLTG